MYIKGTRLNGQVIRFENIFLIWDEKTKYYWLSNLTSKRFNPKRSKYDKLPIIEKIRRNNNKIGKLVKNRRRQESCKCWRICTTSKIENMHFGNRKNIY